MIANFLPNPNKKRPSMIDDFFTCINDITMERAEEMYNLPVDPTKVTLAVLKQRYVLCRPCAEKIAGKSGEKLGRHGCGVRKLSDTLRVLLPLEQRRKLEAEKHARVESLEQYAMQYASGKFDPNFRPPWPMKFTDGERRDRLRCGLPKALACCEQNEPATHFLNVGSEVVGICALAGKTFNAVADLFGGDPSFRKLRNSSDLAVAQRIAANYRKHLNGPSPLGNVTDPDRSSRHAKNKAAKAELNRAVPKGPSGAKPKGGKR